MSAVVSDGWVRVRPADPCPVCQGKKYCMTHPDRGLVACTDDDHPSDTFWEGLNAHVHRLDGRPVGPDWRDNVRPIRPNVEAPPRPAPDPALLDRGYRALLAALPLSPTHRAAMIGRGMSPEEIDAGSYGSLPSDERDRARAVARVTAEIGCSPLGRVPGFARRRDGSVGINAVSGMLVPCRDHQRRVVGLRLRVDDADEVEGGRYRWLSGGHGGAAVDGHTVHVAFPIGTPRRRRVVVLEGEIKGDIVARRTRHPVVCVPGVDSIGRVVDALRLLDDGGGIEVAVAYDADKVSNTHVARAEQRLVAEVRGAGYRVVEWNWSAEDGKGLDDLIVQGLIPSPALYPDELPLAKPADPGASEDVRRMLREAREQRDRATAETRLINRIAAKKDLGGDVGNTVALRLANYASWYAGSHGLRPGDPVPLVAKQIAKEFFDPETGQNVEAVSDTTVGKAIKRFVEKGVVETVNADHVYQHDGVSKKITVPGLVWSDRLGLLGRFANGTVYAEGEQRRRGGKQVKRVPLVCPDCGETHVACVSCGQRFDAATIDGAAVRLAGTDAPQQGADHPRLVDEGGPPQDRVVNNPLTGDVRSVQSRKEGADRVAAARADIVARTRAEPPPRCFPDAGTTVAAAFQRGQGLPGMEPAPPDRYTDVYSGGRP